MTRALKITGWLMMMLLASLIALMSLRYFFISPEAAGGPLVGKKFAEHIVPLLLHVGGGTLALFLGAWGFWGRFRNKYLNLHRWLGRIYLLAVLVGGTSGVYMAVNAFGGLTTRFGFSLLAMLWLATGGMAYWRIRQGNIQAHREWMTRSYALTFSAVTLRLWMILFLSLGYQFPEAYMTVAWLCWIPNLLFAELIVGKGRAKTKEQKSNLNAIAIHAAPQAIRADRQTVSLS
jgi:uncharacterized membrane protein